MEAARPKTVMIQKATPIIENILDSIDTIFAWLSSATGQTIQSYADIQTADSTYNLVCHDGSFLSIIKLDGVNELIGKEEFEYFVGQFLTLTNSALSSKGHGLQFHFSYDQDNTLSKLKRTTNNQKNTSKTLNLSLDDLINERVRHLSNFCSDESCHIAIWTSPDILTKEELSNATKNKNKSQKSDKIPPFRYTQNLLAAYPELRNTHNSFVKSFYDGLVAIGYGVSLLDIHTASLSIRKTIDPEFTADNWRPVLPGDKIKVKIADRFRGDVSDVLWPSLARQLMPRGATNESLTVVNIGDRIYSTVFIDLFPQEVQMFSQLFNKLINDKIPWRISFLMEGGGLDNVRLKAALTSVLAFSSNVNKLINKSINLLRYIDINTDNSVIKLRVCATTWAEQGENRLLKTRVALLARAMQNWGNCDITESCGDPLGGCASTMLGVTKNSYATATVCPINSALQMLPIFRPSSPWEQDGLGGALLFRSPDGKIWPYQPGSPLQTTWIDIIYALPGSGKSVLSNAINLALCLQAGNTDLPRIAILDIGPSSSGLISLLKASLPEKKQNLAAYHRLRMTPEYAINPFDTQLGLRQPTPEERAFLINLITLLTTAVGSTQSYDGMSDMVGLIIDEAYKNSLDNAKPNGYTSGIDESVDAHLEEIGFVSDPKTSWWEVTDALFSAGYIEQAQLAQRYAVPVLSDLALIAREPSITDLYSSVTVSTGESLIDAFNRMIASAIREYPILASQTKFDLGVARVVSLDLDEVAKSGGDAADRQTAIMYMLGRYILAKDFYINEGMLSSVNETYHEYHKKRIEDIKTTSKRLVLDEFHRTSKSSIVRDQVLLDMREGRKWKVQIGLISQSLSDFSEVMIEFATSVFIMDAGPAQAIESTSKVFGLTDTAKLGLKQYVKGPQAGGTTLLAQISTKGKVNTQILTLTLGPIELWSFSTTMEDMIIRDSLYRKIGPKSARFTLAKAFPSGTATRYIRAMLTEIELENGIISEEEKSSVTQNLIDKLVDAYKQSPDMSTLVL